MRGKILIININNEITKIIKKRLKKSFALLYTDIDNFKAYNDKYGFILGNKVIRKNAQILESIVNKFGNKTDFCAHLGGDDFVIISTPEKAETIASQICKKFDKTISKYYNQEDQTHKKIISHDRRGNVVEYPIMTLSIAIITNEYKKFTNPLEISQIAAELKAYAKTKPNGIIKSNFVKERRRS